MSRATKGAAHEHVAAKWIVAEGIAAEGVPVECAEAAKAGRAKHLAENVKRIASKEGMREGRRRR